MLTTIPGTGKNRPAGLGVQHGQGKVFGISATTGLRKFHFGNNTTIMTEPYLIYPFIH